MDEIWLPVVGFESLYEVSNLGKVRRLTAPKRCLGKPLKVNGVLRPATQKGYVYFVLYKDGKYTTIRAHRIVATAFIPNPENKPEINHIDGVKNNNRVDNLEWCTAKENVHHAIHVLKRGGSLKKKKINNG